MNRTIIILISIVILLMSGMVIAQEIQKVVPPGEAFEERLNKVKNPFFSKLPIEEEEYIEPEPVKTDTAQDAQEPEPIGIVSGPGTGETDQQTGETSQTTSTTPTETLEEPVAIVEEIIPLPSISVTGIIWDSDRPQAIIDGTIVDIGDNIKGIEITKITKEGVDGSFNGRPVNLYTQRSPL